LKYIRIDFFHPVPLTVLNEEEVVEEFPEEKFLVSLEIPVLAMWSAKDLACAIVLGPDGVIGSVAFCLLRGQRGCGSRRCKLSSVQETKNLYDPSRCFPDDIAACKLQYAHEAATSQDMVERK
jgi:hypothetical protein